MLYYKPRDENCMAASVLLSLLGTASEGPLHTSSKTNRSAPSSYTTNHHHKKDPIVGKYAQRSDIITGKIQLEYEEVI